jgi:inner membrane protein
MACLSAWDHHLRASALTHFVVGAALALPATESARLRVVLPGWAIPVGAGLLAVVPDLDTYVMRAFGLPHDSFFAHRGFFHSPFFLVLLACVIATIVVHRALPTAALLSLVWSASAITHPLLDMLTNGGAGVMLLFPFSEARLFFPWRPIHVSPLGVMRFFTEAAIFFDRRCRFALLRLRWVWASKSSSSFRSVLPIYRKNLSNLSKGVFHGYLLPFLGPDLGKL